MAIIITMLIIMINNNSYISVDMLEIRWKGSALKKDEYQSWN